MTKKSEEAVKKKGQQGAQTAAQRAILEALAGRGEPVAPADLGVISGNLGRSRVVSGDLG